MTDKAQNEMEAAIAKAIERRREPVVPVDFAARVMQSLPAQKAARPKRHIGRVVGLVAAVVLTGGVFALAPHAVPSFTNLSFDLELMLLGELAGIAYWLAARREV